MIEILNLLKALQTFSKSSHWLAKGNYGDHLLFDRIGEGLSEQIDLLTELSIVEQMKSDPALAIQALKGQLTVLSGIQEPASNEVNADQLLTIVSGASKAIDEQLKKETNTGIQNALQGVAESLQVKKYLLTSRIAK